MVGGILFLFGVLVGATCMWWVQLAAQSHATRVQPFDTEYLPARRVVLRALRAQDTLNLKQLERLLDVTGPVALRYLDAMVTEGILKLQGHRGSDGAFYTLVVR